MNPENPTTALVKTAQSPALARVSNQLALTDKLLTKAEEPFLIPYRKGHKWGFCDRNKNIVIDCKYDKVCHFREGLAATNQGYINSSGDIIIDYTSLGLSSASSFKSGVAIVKSFDTKKYAIIDKSGGLLTSFKYGSIEQPSCGLMVAATDHYNNAYIIDLLGNEIHVDNADSLRPFMNDSAICFKFDKLSRKNYRYIDKDGNSFTDYKYYNACDFNSELATVSLKPMNNNSYCY